MTRFLRRPSRMGLAIVAAIVLLATTMAGPSPADATFKKSKAAPSIALSFSPDRSGAVPLQGASLEPGREVAIFVAPEWVWASKAKFYVNGKLVRTESLRPFDLGGTAKGGKATLVSTDTFVQGTNTVAVDLFFGWFKKTRLSATFEVLAPPAPPLPTIAEIATGDPQFSTLVTALSLASEKGPIDFIGAVSDPKADLTVFAPTNDAFAALGSTLDAALADPSGLLTTVLAYHVLGSSESGADLVAAGTFTTLQGEDVKITLRDGKVFINDAKVVIADIQASNGIVHVIDAVLLPPSITDPGTAPGPGPAKATIGDQVSLAGGGGVDGVTVDLFSTNADGTRAAYLGSDTTEGGGIYSFEVDAGCYVVVFIAPDGSAFPAGQFKEKSVCVAAGEVRSDVDAELAYRH